MSNKERLIELLNYLKKNGMVRNQRHFVEEIEENNSVVSAYKTGRRNFSEAFVYKVKNKYPFISLNWLKKGEGQMIIENYFNDTNQDMINEVHGTYGVKQIYEPEKYNLLERSTEVFTQKLLDLMNEGKLFTLGYVQELSNTYTGLIREREEQIRELHIELGKLKTIIEILNGKSPEDILKKIKYFK